MAANDFVSVLWGILCVLILVILVAVVGVVGFIWVRNSVEQRKAAVIVGEGESATPLNRFAFGEFQPIKGKPYVMSPYGVPAGYKGSLWVGTPGTVRNYLFVHTEDQNCHYLLPTHTQLVLSLEMLRTGTSKVGPVQWLYCHIVDADTNGDGRLTEEDAFSVAFADPDGRRLTPVLRGVSRVLGSVRTNGDSMLLFYRRDDKTWLSEINIAERSVVRTSELPVLPQVAAITGDA